MINQSGWLLFIIERIYCNCLYLFIFVGMFLFSEWMYCCSSFFQSWSIVVCLFVLFLSDGSIVLFIYLCFDFICYSMSGPFSVVFCFCFQNGSIVVCLSVLFIYFFSLFYFFIYSFLFCFHLLFLSFPLSGPFPVVLFFFSKWIFYCFAHSTWVTWIVTPEVGERTSCPLGFARFRSGVSVR